jgi:dynein heavy chain
MKIHLIKLERVFAPFLTRVTWVTFEIDDYFDEVKEVLTPIESFVKDITDADQQIEVLLNSIQQYVLVYLPEKAVTPEEFKDMNVQHRKVAEKKIETKSLSAEKATVDLVNKFVEKAVEIPLRDDSGKFRLPQSMITEENKRSEESKPINKYDWLQFDKIYKPVGYALPDDNLVLCYREYEGLSYDITLLHIDCVELFAYYNHRMVAALSKCTKRSMEMLKARSHLTSVVRSYDCYNRDPPLLRAAIELSIPKFTMTPSIVEMQKFYDAVLLNIIETHYAVTTWGKQAKLR